jgi:hypothetical protein
MAGATTAPARRYQESCGIARALVLAQRILTETVGTRGALQEPAFDEIPQATDHRYKIDENPPVRFVAIVPALHGYDDADPERRQRDQQGPKAAQAFAFDGYRIAVEEFKPADGAERDRSDEHYCQQHQPVSRPADPAIETEQKFSRTRIPIRPNPFGRRNNASSALRAHDGTGEHRPMRKRFRSLKASTSGIAADRSRERAQEFTGRRGSLRMLRNLVVAIGVNKVLRHSDVHQGACQDARSPLTQTPRDRRWRQSSSRPSLRPSVIGW